MIRNFYIQTAAPRGDDPGRIEEAHFTVVGDEVVLTDSGGTPLPGNHRAKLGTDDALTVARRLLRARVPQRSGFNRPLAYVPFKDGW